MLNWRAHGVERAAERRATRLGRMVNDMITWGDSLQREREVLYRWKSRVNVPEYTIMPKSNIAVRAQQWLSRCLVRAWLEDTVVLGGLELALRAAC